MNHQDCRCEMVVSSEVGHVTLCQGCGQVQLAMNCVTLRFDTASFRTMVNMVTQAQWRMDRLAAPSAGEPAGMAANGLH
jgi:hypothetical protein